MISAVVRLALEAAGSMELAPRCLLGKRHVLERIYPGFESNASNETGKQSRYVTRRTFIRAQVD